MKIFIFGPPGAGKTTIAREVTQNLTIPHFDIDTIFFHEEKDKHVNPEKRNVLLNEILLREKDWIIEGMYRDAWMDSVIQKADAIFVILPRIYTNIFRIIRRSILRVSGKEKFERKTTISAVWNLLKARFLFRKRLEEFEERVEKEGKKCIIITRNDDIYSFVKPTR